MTKLEVNAKVAEAIEHLMMAQPGRPSAERQIHRQAANQIMGSLEMKDLRKIDDDVLAVLGDLA
jgi:hypothetical protein